MDEVKRYQDNLALVTYIANKWKSSFPTEYHEDLLAQGRLGLWAACKNFNESFGFKFGTFAWKCINNEIGKMYRIYRNTFNKPHVSMDDIIYRNENGDITVEDRVGYEPDFDANLIVSDILNKYKNNDIIIMRLDGLTQREIANRLNISQGEVSRRISRCKKEILNMIYPRR